MAPHLVRWQQTYANQGLSVVYVADGKRVDVAAARSRMSAEQLPYPIFVDERSSATAAYGVRVFPTAYLLDRTGRVVWEGVPALNPPAVEQAIQSALAPQAAAAR